MPEISRFYGIVIRMFYADHNPPHFHAKYGDAEAQMEIQSLAVMGGHLPPRAMGLVVEWAALHQQELLDAWGRAQNHQPPGKVDPLI